MAWAVSGHISDGVAPDGVLRRHPGEPAPLAVHQLVAALEVLHEDGRGRVLEDGAQPGLAVAQRCSSAHRSGRSRRAPRRRSSAAPGSSRAVHSSHRQLPSRRAHPDRQTPSHLAPGRAAPPARRPGACVLGMGELAAARGPRARRAGSRGPARRRRCDHDGRAVGLGDAQDLTRELDEGRGADPAAPRRRLRGRAHATFSPAETRSTTEAARARRWASSGTRPPPAVRSRSIWVGVASALTTTTGMPAVVGLGLEPVEDLGARACREGGGRAG